ncbi:MAG TPA: FtsX-like permease family protein [Rhodothermales bacterium]|nr:FtsX-like permease family protein [Rhodothermales bacterium]
MDEPTRSIRWRWILRMAWRDGRSSTRHLALFLASMVVGVAALVAIESFRANLKNAVESQARSLLGADLQISQNSPFDERVESLIDSVGGEQAREIRFTSMAYFPGTHDTRITQVRAQEGAFPFYGSLETNPPEAGRRFRESRSALLDERLMLQFGMAPGDSVWVGTRSYVIGGALLRIPGESAMDALFGPRVYIPIADIDSTLLDAGSRVRFYTRFRLTDQAAVDAAADRFKALETEGGINVSTVEDASDNWSDALGNLYGFLSLLGFMALLLGGIGVAGAVHAYTKEKVALVATLRCLGARTVEAFLIYLTQAAAVGLVAAVLGATGGMLVQVLLPDVLADFLPVDVVVEAQWIAVAIGTVIGLFASIVFATIPLLAIRRVPALAALRAAFERPEPWFKDGMRWFVLLVVFGAVTGYAIWTTGRWTIGLWFAAGVLAVFLCLAGIARLVMWASRRYFPSSWPYVWRQGLANLYRPNNHTTVLVLALGLGTTLILTVYLLQFTLLGSVQGLDARGGANTILFDIQGDQIAGVEQTVRDLGLPVEEVTPVVTMRLKEVKGRTIDEIRDDSTMGHKWPFVREYRSTYRDTLTASETVVSGAWHGSGSGGRNYVSLEEEIAEGLGVEVGDDLVIDVQGVALPVTVGSVRSVEWRQMSSNFFMVFEPGLLSQAPRFYILATRVANEQEAADLQRAVVQAFPNVSLIDLDLILRTAGAILDRIAFVIRFMALFCIATGLLVLIASVSVSRLQRLRESVLLRTLGASAKQIGAILNIEQALLGMMAAITGTLLSFAVSWAIARFMFEIEWIPSWGAIPVAIVSVTTLTILFGTLGRGATVRRPPLEVLRNEL